MANRCKIVLVGGGSNQWIPKLVKDMLLTPALSGAEFVLLDINKKASDRNKEFLEKLVGQLELGAKKPQFVSTESQSHALKGANYVIVTISTGGLKAMAHDLAIPEDYGIYHTVGDTAGPGGWSRLIRNFDVFVSLAHDINQYAHGAVVLNYTNPMATLTDVLARICKGPVVGLCHGLFQNLKFIQYLYKVKSEDEIVVKYAGLNHFFWITAAKVGKRDIIADLKHRIKKTSLADMLKRVNKDEAGYASNTDVAMELFRLTGAMPYLGDRHTCEFFPCYITSKKNMRKYKIIRTSIEDRQKLFSERTKNLRKHIKGKIPEGFFVRSRETAAHIIEAHWQGKKFIDVGNLPNRGQVSNLPAGAVVETAVLVDQNGISPIAFGPLPPVVQAMCEPWIRVYKMVVDACFEKDRQLAMQALRLDPTCSHLNGEQVNEMGSRLLRAHKQFLNSGTFG